MPVLPTLLQTPLQDLRTWLNLLKIATLSFIPQLIFDAPIVQGVSHHGREGNSACWAKQATYCNVA